MQSIIKSARVTLGPRADGFVEPTSALPSSAPARSERCDKSVRLLDTGGVATAIEVVCSCGEITMIQLDCPRPGESLEEPTR